MVLLGHGSRLEDANRELLAVADRLSEALGVVVETAFLQLAEPPLDAVVGRAAENGACEVVVVPFFLFPGVHLQQDLPVLVQELQARHPGMRIATARCLGDHPGVVQAAAERAREMMV